MRYHPFLALSVLPAGLRAIATALPPRWGSMRMKHAWNSIPENWESLGHPPAGTTIDLHIALKPHREDALVETLFEVSDPAHPKYVVHYSAHGYTHAYRRAIADMGYT